MAARETLTPILGAPVQGTVMQVGGALRQDGLMPQRHVPQNIEAERALLANLLINNRAFEDVSEFLKPAHFANPVHGKIYAAIGHFVDRGHVVDPVTLKDYFDQQSDLAAIGGWAYLVELADAVISLQNSREYGRIIHDSALRRALIHIGEGMITQACTHELEGSATQQIEGAEEQLFELATLGETGRAFQPFGEALASALQVASRAFKREGHVVGITSGLQDLDKYLGGLHPSDLLIIAGRPSMGKTALATNIAFNAARAAMRQEAGGGLVAFFSLEMSAEQLATRLLAQESRITSDAIRRGEISKDDFAKITEVSRQISALPLYIDDTPALTVSALRTRARRLQRQKGLHMIVVDYLQLLQASKSSDSRVNEISEISRGLKALAKELDVPVIALSQLSRAVEQRDDKRPQLADLRDSGSIEQDADVVMFVFREEYYEARKQPEIGTEKHLEWQRKVARLRNVAELILAKQRHGPIGTIKLHFDASYTKFSDFIEDTHLPEMR